MFIFIILTKQVPARDEKRDLCYSVLSIFSSIFLLTNKMCFYTSDDTYKGKLESLQHFPHLAL